MSSDSFFTSKKRLKAIQTKIIKLGYKEDGELTKLIIDTLYTYEWKLPTEDYTIVIIDYIIRHRKLCPLTNKLHEMLKSLSNINIHPIFINHQELDLNVLIFLIDVGCVFYYYGFQNDQNIFRLGGQCKRSLFLNDYLYEGSGKRYDYIKRYMITT
jgi:hypothetical protein